MPGIIFSLMRFLIILYLCIGSSIPAQAKKTSSVNKPPIKKILIVVAMETEALPIIKTLRLKKMTHSFPGLPMQGYLGNFKKFEILLITNGVDPIHHVPNIGTQAATLSTHLGVEYFHPDLIISIGTAGGVENNGARQRDIYISRKIYFFARRIPLKGFHDYALGGYQSTTLAPMDKRNGLKSGIICSGDSFDDNQTDYNMFVKLHCSAIDMEAAGVAWVSMLTKTPMFALKGITNFVKGEDTHHQFQKNLPIVTAELSSKLKEVLTNLSSDN